MFRISAIRAIDKFYFAWRGATSRLWLKSKPKTTERECKVRKRKKKKEKEIRTRTADGYTIFHGHHRSSIETSFALENHDLGTCNRTENNLSEKWYDIQASAKVAHRALLV